MNKEINEELIKRLLSEYKKEELLHSIIEDLSDAIKDITRFLKYRKKYKRGWKDDSHTLRFTIADFLVNAELLKRIFNLNDEKIDFAVKLTNQKIERENFPEFK
jgi:hypothetical protein